MALPCRHDIPETPILQIDVSAAPPYPHYYSAHLTPLLPHIATRIVNQAGYLASKNPVRMFFFNLISQNNWFNEIFEEVFRMCVTHIELTVSRSSAAPEAVLESSVDFVLTVYSSGMVLQYPDLKYEISPQLYQASTQNAGLFNELRMEMQRVFPPGHPSQPQYPPYSGHQYPPGPQYQNYGGHPGYSPHPGYNNGYLPPHTDPRFAPPPTPYGYRPEQAFQRHGNNGPGMFQPNHSFNTSNFAPRPDPGARDYHVKTTGNPVQNSESDTMDPYSRYQTPRQNFSKPPDNKRINQNDYFVNKNEVMKEPYEPEVIMSNPAQFNHQQSGDHSVDRERHMQVIGVSPASVTFPNGQYSATPSEQQILEEIKSESEVEISVTDVLSADLSVEISIAQFRAESIKAVDFLVHRKYVYVPTSIISSADVKSQLKQWFKAQTLLELVENLQNTLKEVQTKQPVNANLLTLIREVDQCITSKINDFLVHSLGVKYSIESFMEDYSSLELYILRKTGADAVKALHLYDQEMIKMLKMEIDESNLDEMIILPENVFVGYIPNTYSITIVSFDRVTLNLPVPSPKMLTEPLLNTIAIDPIKHKIVFDSVKNLFNENNPDNIFEGPIDTHLLLTRDGVRYRVCKILSKEEFYLKLV